MLKLKGSRYVRKLPIAYFVANSVIVITGASSGIGRQLAMKYAERGTRIVIGSRSIDAL